MSDSNGNPGDATNRQAPPVNGGDGGGGLSRIMKIAIAGVALLLLLLAVPLACQAIRGGGSSTDNTSSSGGDSNESRSEGTGAGEAGSPESASSSSQAESSSMESSSMESSSMESTRETSEASSVERRDSVGDLASLSGQTVDGSSVTVPSVTLSGTSGWLSVREETDDGMGEVIGYAPLNEGENSNVRVSLDAPVQGTGNLYVSVHEDSPGDGSFSFPDGDPTTETAAGKDAIQPVAYDLSEATTSETAASETATSDDEDEPDSLPDSGGTFPDMSSVSWISVMGAVMIALGSTIRYLNRVPETARDRTMKRKTR